VVVTVAESRTTAVPFETAYDRAIVVSLPDIFGHRRLAIPPVVRVDDQEGDWGREVGQTRTICTSDGGRLRETLRELDRPHRFGYRIDHVRGPMRPLIRHLDGAWTFEPAGAGTVITWSWEMTPSSVLTTPLVAVVGRMWHGYARQALMDLEAILDR
jgi:hypothetical protein